MNRFLTNRLRTCARRLRFMLNTENVPADSAAIAAEKASMLDELRAQLVVFFGNPPATFTWAAKNKDGEQVVIRDTTPQAFYAEAGFDVTGTVSLINDPRNEYYKLYTVEYLGNTVGGRPTTYINVPIEELKRYARSTLEDNEPVWFGCDMGKYVDRKTSAMDTAVYDYNLVLGASKLEMSKRDRLVFGESLMTHAMVFIGFDRDPADSNRAISWQVENSWGETGPDKGRWILTDDWFDHFVYQIVVENSKLSEEIRAVLDQTPTVLPPWDPMGALASL